MPRVALARGWGEGGAGVLLGAWAAAVAAGMAAAGG